MTRQQKDQLRRGLRRALEHRKRVRLKTFGVFNADRPPALDLRGCRLVKAAMGDVVIEPPETKRNAP